MDKKKDWKYWLNEWESHLSALCFIVIGVMLTLQVISRYVFGHSFTKIEEIATQLYVLMTYTGVASAVTHRKHLTISALPDAMPFKVRKALLILADVVFIGFCVWIIPPFLKYIKALGSSKLPVSHIPEKYFYIIIPIFMALTVIRLIQDIIRLWKEGEKNLGETAPSLDLNAYERIAQARKEAEAIADAREKEEKGGAEK